MNAANPPIPKRVPKSPFQPPWLPHSRIRFSQRLCQQDTRYPAQDPFPRHGARGAGGEMEMKQRVQNPSRTKSDPRMLMTSGTGEACTDASGKKLPLQ